MLVALVRTLVRDAIAEFVSVLSVRLWEWLAEEGCTLGVGTPWVIAQVSALVGKWADKIAHFFRALINSLRRLKGILHQLWDLIDSLTRKMRMLARVGKDNLLGRAGSDLNLIHGTRLKHILTGDSSLADLWHGKVSGGHLWPGLKGQTPFPKHWTVEDIKRYVSDVATDPSSLVMGAPRTAGCSPRQGSRHGSGCTGRATGYGSRSWWSRPPKVSLPPFPGREHRHDHRSAQSPGRAPARRVPGRIVDLYEGDVEAGELQLAIEELFDALVEDDVTITPQLADEMLALARELRVTRFSPDEVRALVTD
jgi:hypothetical protein